MGGRFTYRFGLLVLVLLACGLRLYRLDVQSLWYDEGVTAQIARLGVGELVRWTADDIQPPFYYLLVAGWLRIIEPWAGSLAYTLRWLSAAWGVLLVPLVAALAHRLWDRRAALGAALVATTAPTMVYYGQEARMYTLLVLWVAGSAYALVRWRQARPVGFGSVGGYVITGLAALYTHYFAAFALLALVLYWLWAWWRSDRPQNQLVPFLAANAVILAGYAAWLPAMLRRLQADSSYWSGTLKPVEALWDVIIHTTTGATAVMREDQARIAVLILAMAVLLWLAALRRYPAAPHTGLLLALWALLPTVLILTLAYRVPKFNPRYVLIIWPAWALFVGAGLAALCRNPFRFPSALNRSAFVATLGIILGVHAFGLINGFTHPAFAKTDWRDAIAYMYTHRQPDEAVLLVSGHAYPVFDAYVPATLGVTRYRLPEIEILDVRQVLGWEETAHRLNHDLAGWGGVWLFLWQDNVVDPAGVVTTLLDRYATPLPTPTFPYIGLRHYRLQPHRPFPTQPPVAQPGTVFADRLRLVGAELTAEVLWLYWQALRPDLPDLQVALTWRDLTGQVVRQEIVRPVGYDFPTTRWQVGETYPVRMDIPAGAKTLELTVFVAADAMPLGSWQLTWP
jgi:hypothetical protein